MKICVFGAGAVGCEFADVFAAFGTQVSLIEVMPNILPVEDTDSSKEVERAFKKRKIDVLTGAKISNVKVGKSDVSMTVESGGNKTDLKVDVVLVAAGEHQQPALERLAGAEEGIARLAGDGDPDRPGGAGDAQAVRAVGRRMP